MDRLVTFLGTGKYEETTYVFEGSEVRTRYVAHALAAITKPREIVLLATDEAWRAHGMTLAAVLTAAGHPQPRRQSLPPGQNPEEIWQQFHAVVEAVTPATQDASVLFDITHGFRSQPFFAAAALDFVRAVKCSATQLQVVYGAFDARNEDRTPIWDLTVFVELLDWSRSLLLFLRTGRTEDVAGPLERLGRELKKQWAYQGKQGPMPKIDRLAKDLRSFGDDLVTLRTGSLLCGAGRPGSAHQLIQAIDEVRPEVERLIPPLAQVLASIRSMAEPLVVQGRLSEPQGLASLHALARLYFNMGRYAEAAATLREAHVTRYASKVADCPGHPDFCLEQRELAENAWFQATPDLAKEIAALRNDIEHAGYRQDPRPPETIRRQLEGLIDQMAIGEPTDSVASPTVHHGGN